ncbi:MAG: lipoate--protein ligase family protein, partial [Anaerolineae bacterium]|nr:lipoate--protein ligase family protein [Anaerolineae bacterium]
QIVGQEESLPILRLYGWQPLCLSLGYGQRLSDADQERIQSQGWGIVRRPTGGKAILHGRELTYSVTLSRDHEFAQGDVVESYRRISEALIAALKILGLSPQSEPQAKGNKGLGPVCFEVPSHYEITVGGKKLIGSAQVRRREGILQHGSLPLYGDISQICDALHYETEVEREEAKHQVRARATTLEAVLGRRITWNEAADALTQGFQHAFDLAFLPEPMTAAEFAAAEEIMQETYANPDWLHKR